MRRAGLALAATLALRPASAHVSGAALSGASLWNYDPWLAVPLYGAGVAFLLGTRNLWRAAGFGRGVSRSQAAAYWAAWLTLALAFLSPLHWLGERLFAAHMAEHELLLLVAAPLFAYAQPGAAALWSLPAGWRQFFGRLGRRDAVGGLSRWFASPVAMTVQQAALLYLWHVPSLYQLALRDELAHRLEHISFFASAYLFWRALLAGPGGRRANRARQAVAVGCLFVTLLHSGLLGALLTLSPRLWYPEQEQLAAEFGLTPLEDQQLAGVIMWGPMSVVYTLAALWFSYGLLQPRRAAGARAL
jgi:putative membrane protein